ncbi:MAG: hypothetical protein ABIY40_08385 [Rhodanobacteraceae bacterium]
MFQGDAWSGGSGPAAHMLDMYRVTCSERRCPMLELEASDVDAIRGLIGDLTTRWDALAVGQSLTLPM